MLLNTAYSFDLGVEGEPTEATCHTLWLDIRVQWYQQRTFLDIARSLFLHCGLPYMQMMHSLEPHNRDLAELAWRTRPDLAESWFWVAEVRGDRQGVTLQGVTDENWQEIVTLLQEGLRRNPHDGLRWRMLGDIYRTYRPEQALSAYLQSCYNGDPGYNGCYRAGRMAEEAGDYAAAIRYYRLSLWPESKRHADELERRLQRERR